MLKYNDWLTVFEQKNKPDIRLFCFHYGGGSASVFRQWAKGLIDEAELVAIQLPGREERFNEPLLDNISAVLDNLFLNFNHYTDKPFIFWGHSIGALIAFEFVRTLRIRNKLQPRHLIVSGAKAPQVPLKKLPIHNLSDVQFVEELKKYNGMPDYIMQDQELMSIFIPIMRADFRISEIYNYYDQEPFNFPITALGGVNDYTFDSQDLAKWHTQTNSSFKQYILAGDHFFINTSYKETIKIINQILYEEIKKFKIKP